MLVCTWQCHTKAELWILVSDFIYQNIFLDHVSYTSPHLPWESYNLHLCKLWLPYFKGYLTTENTKHILFEIRVNEIKTSNLEISRQIASNLFSPACSLHMNSSRYPGQRTPFVVFSWSILYSSMIQLFVCRHWLPSWRARHAGGWSATGLPSSFRVDRNVRLLLLFRRWGWGWGWGRITYTDLTWSIFLFGGVGITVWTNYYFGPINT